MALDYKPIKLKTPLRYPGGKSRAIKFLSQYLPTTIQAYIEPFMGGASMALYVGERYPNAMITVNDAYYPLFNFWRTLQSNGKDMSMLLEDVKHSTMHNKDKQIEAYKTAQKNMDNKQVDNLTAACSFYIANKCSFSGLATSSFSEQAYNGNFTLNSIKKLPDYQKKIYRWNITNFDYQIYMHPDPEADFFFLDPPYDIKSFLYGHGGDIHKSFDHTQFKSNVEALHRWGSKFMITYNSNPKLIEAYASYTCLTWDLKYTMRSTGTYRQDQEERKELLIMNYGK